MSEAALRSLHPPPPPMTVPASSSSVSSQLATLAAAQAMQSRAATLPSVTQVWRHQLNLLFLFPFCKKYR